MESEEKVCFNIHLCHLLIFCNLPTGLVVTDNDRPQYLHITFTLGKKKRRLVFLVLVGFSFLSESVRSSRRSTSFSGGVSLSSHKWILTLSHTRSPTFRIGSRRGRTVDKVFGQSTGNQKTTQEFLRDPGILFGDLSVNGLRRSSL